MNPLNKRLSSLLIVVILFFTHSTVLLAQEASGQSEWGAVQAIAKGKKVAIEMKSGDRIEGKIINISDTGLELIRKKNPVGVNRMDIRRVYLLRSGSRLKAALIGAGVGAGLGAGAGAGFLHASGGSDSAVEYMAGITLAAAGIGAALGAIAGRGSKQTLVYESR